MAVIDFKMKNILKWIENAWRMHACMNTNQENVVDLPLCDTTYAIVVGDKLTRILGGLYSHIRKRGHVSELSYITEVVIIRRLGATVSSVWIIMLTCI